jgi:signal transduction histidine kinase
LIVLWAMVLAVAGCLVGTLWQDYLLADRRAQRQALTFAQLVTEDTTATFLATDIILRHVRDGIPLADFQSGIALDTARRQGIVEYLRSQQALVPGVVVLSLVNADGIVYADSLDVGSGVSIADRGYFQDLKGTDKDAREVSPILRGRVSDKLGVQLSRRLEGPDGRFLGVVVAAIGVEDHFVSYWKSLQLDEGVWVGLVNLSDQIMLARYPPVAAEIGTPVPASTFVKLAASTGSVDIGVAQTFFDSSDGLAGTIAIRKMTDYPFYGVVVLPRSVYLADWWRLALRIIVAVTALIAAGIVLTVWGIRQARMTHLLRYSEERLRRAQAVASVSSWEFDVVNDRVIWSDEAYFMAGVPLGSPVTYQTVVDAIHPQDRELHAKAWQEAKPGAKYDVVHRAFVNGTVKWIHTLGDMTFDDDGHLIRMIGTAQDVTALKAQEAALGSTIADLETSRRQLQRQTADLQELAKELTAARDRAEVANDAKSQFLANTSHELRTPLNAVIGFAEMLQLELYGTVNPKQREYIEDIHSSGAHLLEIINDILDLSKIEAGREDLREEMTDLAALIESQMAAIKPRARQGGVVVVRASDPALPLIFVDPLKTKQMMLNLISNAVKFTPAGGTVSVSARIESDHSDWPGWIRIDVVDTGIGIRADQIPLVKEPFRQVESHLSRKFAGTGLGLAITEAQIHLHGGRLDIQSALAAGTTVTLWFPAWRAGPSLSVRGGRTVETLGFVRE